jgi:tetratricopeptide (TPR) repeat protein
MRRLYLHLLNLFLLLLCATPGYSQEGRLSYLDSIRHRLDTTRSTADKLNLLLELSAMTVDRAQSEAYAAQGVELAQLSRDPRLIATTYLGHAYRFLNNPSVADNLDQATKNLQQAEQVAKEYGLESVLVSVYCDYARSWHFRGSDVRALSYTTQALAIAAGIDNDSAKVRAYCVTGDIYLYMNQMLLALRNYLNGLDVAEKSGKPDLLRYSYAFLRFFYQSIGDYDKSLDYALKVYDKDRELWNANMVQDLLVVGDIFLKKDQPDLALRMYEESIHVADTFRFDLLKIDAYHRMFLLYSTTKQYEKGVQFLFAHREMLEILHVLGFDPYIDELVAVNYTQQGRYDSALYYFRKSAPDAIAKGVPESQIDFYMDFGEYYKKTNNPQQAIFYCNKAYALAAATNNLTSEEKCTDSLESLFVAVRNFPEALVCEQRAAVERDSIRTQTQATDLMKLEVENDQRRRERLAEEERVRTEHRHNIQYMGFTMGLVVLFVALVMLARLSVPVSVIRALVFVAFIFLFEFIIMLADRQIQAWTAEEPWKVLLLKIILAAGMVPLHHWLEHKVVHYLSHHRKTPAHGAADAVRGPAAGAPTGALPTAGVSGGEHAEAATAGGGRL